MRGWGRCGKRGRLFAWVVAFVLLLLVVDYFAYPYGLPPGGRSGNRGQNGLWLRYTWYFGQHTDAERQQLAQRLHDQQITFAYCHVRGIQRDGTLKFHFPKQAARLVHSLHDGNSSVKVLAWVYVGNAASLGDVDLSQPDVRRAMVQEARWLVTKCGFDGVQWDYEICPDGDSNFLSLLRETRAALPSDKLLSIATPLCLPGPLTRWGWSAGYYAQVAANCDQIAVMGYDSGMYLPRTYVWLMQQQVVQVTQAVGRANARCQVLVGVPTYGQGGLSHLPHAENIGMALRGVRQGLADSRTDRRAFGGVAIFADYTTQADEWRTYDRDWLGEKTE